MLYLVIRNVKFPLRGRKNVDLEGNEEGGEGGKEGRCSSEGEISYQNTLLWVSFNFELSLLIFPLSVAPV